jgi:hypothetical protein
MRRSIKNEIKVEEEETPSIPCRSRTRLSGDSGCYIHAGAHSSSSSIRGKGYVCWCLILYIQGDDEKKRNNIIEIGPYSTAVVCVCMISDTSILPARWICVWERHGICCAVYLNCGGFWKCDKLRAPGISLGSVLTNWIRTILLPLSVFLFLI